VRLGLKNDSTARYPRRISPLCMATSTAGSPAAVVRRIQLSGHRRSAMLSRYISIGEGRHETLRLARLGILIRHVGPPDRPGGPQPQGMWCGSVCWYFGPPIPRAMPRGRPLRERLRSSGTWEGQNVVSSPVGENAQVGSTAGLGHRAGQPQVVGVVHRAARRGPSSIPSSLRRPPTPFGWGLVASLAPPGRNVTGVISR